MGSDLGDDRTGESSDAISIHAPRMGSDKALKNTPSVAKISIHAPRMGSDFSVTFLIFLIFLFQSTLPAWGATKNDADINNIIAISIHAPRMGSDFLVDEVLPGDSFISIHAPRMGSDSKNMRFLLCFCNFH